MRRYFCRAKQAERKRIFKQPRDFTVKVSTFFRWEFMLYQVVIDFFLRVPVSFGEMFIKRAQIQSY